MQVLSQTTFRYHHRLVHRRIRSALIRPSLFLYPDEGSLRSSEAPVSIHQSTRCHNPEKSQKLPPTCMQTSNILRSVHLHMVFQRTVFLAGKNPKRELKTGAGATVSVGLDEPGFDSHYG